MAKRGNQKLKIIYLLKYLMEETDSEHGVSMSKIINYLESNEISAERKSVYDDVACLNDMGYDIIKVAENGETTYRLCSRDFQIDELKVLVDAIQASRFISAKESKNLIEKLKGLTSKNNGEKLQRQVYVDNRVKRSNEGNIFSTINTIHEAIAENVDLEIIYGDFNINGNLEKKNTRKVSPWQLVWSNEKYYLLAYDKDLESENRDGIRTFRVDKMVSLKKTNDKFLTSIFKGLDIATYAGKHFDMGIGDIINVKLLCDNSVVGQVFDNFGKNIMLIPTSNDKFEVQVNVANSNTFFTWVMNYEGKIKILWPNEAVDKFKEIAKKALSIYE